MKDLVLFTLLGLGSGAFIAGLGLSAIVSFRGGGVINLATGAYAMLGAYVFYALRTSGELILPPLPFIPGRIDFGGPWSTVPAFAVALLVCALLGAALDVIVFRRLRHSSPLAKLIATLGLLLTLQAIILVRFGPDGQSAPAVLSERSLTILGLPIPEDQFLFSGVVIVLAAALIVLYRYSRFGLATRAAAESEAMAMRQGLSPDRLSMLNCVLAAALAGGLGILFAPASTLDDSTLALAIIPALAAALLARFESFSIVVLAGFAMGIIESLIVWLQTLSWFPTAGGNALPGVSDLVYFLIIAVVMYTRGDPLPARGTLAEKRLPEAPAARRIVRPALVLALVGAVTMIVFPAAYREAEINTVIAVVMCLSLVVITGFVGQVSLLQFGLAGATALVLTKLTASSGIGFPFAPLIGVAVAVMVGLLTALPTLRVRGVALAIITMSGAVAISNFWLGNQSWGFNPLNGAVGSPKLLGFNLGPDAHFGLGPGGTPSPIFGFLCLAVAVGAGMLVAAVRRGELGQRMLAVRSNERAAAAAGISVRETKLVGYGIASLLAGVGGALYAYSFQVADSGNYDITVALSFVAFAYLGGITTVTGAIIGGLLSTEALIAYLAQEKLGLAPNTMLVIAGLLLILTVVQNPDGIAGAVRRTLATRRRRSPASPSPSTGPSSPVASAGPSAPLSSSTSPTTSARS
jgi:branched-chain amino acid transport system permease protein